MGAVYQAFHLRLNSPVAVKLLHPHVAAQPDAFQRLRREAQMLARLDHPHAVRVYDVVLETPAFIVMEFVPGEDLGQRLDRVRTLDLEQTLSIADQLLDALAAAHALSIVHRDLKPANVLVEDRPSGLFARVVDFGIAVPNDGGAGHERLTQAGQVPGTAGYMSPEQIQGSKVLDGRADLYSLACLVFELLTGRPPFVAVNPIDVLSAHLYREPPTLTEVAPGLAVPHAVEAVIRKALSKRPEARFESAAQMRAALQAAAQAQPRGDRPARSSANAPAFEFVAAEATDPPVWVRAEGADPTVREAVLAALAGVGAQASLYRADAVLQSPVVLVIPDRNGDGLDSCKNTLAHHPDATVLLCGPEDDFQLFSRSIEARVFDFVPLPLDPADLGKKVVRALRGRRR